MVEGDEKEWVFMWLKLSCCQFKIDCYNYKIFCIICMVATKKTPLDVMQKKMRKEFNMSLQKKSIKHKGRQQERGKA